MAKSDRYHHGNLRQACLEGARAMLEEDGSGTISLREVARRAGVSPAAPYRHFKDREDLLRALAADALATMRKKAAGGGPAEVGAVVGSFSRDHPVWFGLLCARLARGGDESIAIGLAEFLDSVSPEAQAEATRAFGIALLEAGLRGVPEGRSKPEPSRRPARQEPAPAATGPAGDWTLPTELL